MMLLRVAVPLDCCGGAFGSGFIHILMLRFQLPSRFERSLWFSLSFDISIICFIISCGFGWPAESGAGTAAAGADAVGLCANDAVVISDAHRVAIKKLNIFMTGFCQ